MAHLLSRTKKRGFGIPLTACVLSMLAGPMTAQGEISDSQLVAGLPSVREPMENYPLPQDGNILEMRTTSDARRVVIRQSISSGDALIDRVSVLELASGKITRLQDWPAFHRESRVMAISPDDRTVVLEGPDGSVASLYDLDTGKVILSYQAPEGRWGDLRVSGDGKHLACVAHYSGMTEAVYWHSDDPKPHIFTLDVTSAEPTFIVTPLSGGDKLMVCEMPPHKNLPTKLSIADPASDKLQPLFEETPSPFIRGGSNDDLALVFRMQDDPHRGWSGMDTWSLTRGEKMSSTKLDLPLSTLTMEMMASSSRFTADSRHVFARYCGALVWEPSTGKFRGSAGPGKGGFTAFDITPDGSRLVAVRGYPVEGKLQPQGISIYDTSSLVK